jgi:hypothetical protein
MGKYAAAVVCVSIYYVEEDLLTNYPLPILLIEKRANLLAISFAQMSHGFEIIVNIF